MRQPGYSDVVARYMVCLNLIANIQCGGIGDADSFAIRARIFHDLRYVTPWSISVVISRRRMALFLSLTGRVSIVPRRGDPCALPPVFTGRWPIFRHTGRRRFGIASVCLVFFSHFSNYFAYRLTTQANTASEVLLIWYCGTGKARTSLS